MILKFLNVNVEIKRDGELKYHEFPTPSYHLK